MASTKQGPALKSAWLQDFAQLRTATGRYSVDRPEPWIDWIFGTQERTFTSSAVIRGPLTGSSTASAVLRATQPRSWFVKSLGSAAPVTTATATATLANGASVGNTVIVGVNVARTASGQASVSDSKGNTWVSSGVTWENGIIAVFSSVITVALSAGDTIAVSGITAGAERGLWASEYKGPVQPYVSASAAGGSGSGYALGNTGDLTIALARTDVSEATANPVFSDIGNSSIQYYSRLATVSGSTYASVFGYNNSSGPEAQARASGAGWGGANDYTMVVVFRPAVALFTADAFVKTFRTASFTASAVVKRSYGSGLLLVDTSSATSDTVTIPAHSNGDIAIAIASVAGNTIPSLAPGWTLMSSHSSDPGVISAWKNLDGVEASAQFLNATLVGIVIYRGASRTTSNAFNSGSTNTTVVYSGVSPTDAPYRQQVLLAVKGSTDSALETPPSGYSNRLDRVSATTEIAIHDSGNLGFTSTAGSLNVGGSTSVYHTHGIELSTGFNAYAVLRKTVSGSFTANSTIVRAQSGSLTASSVVRAAQTGSLTSDATIKRTASSALTADAVMQRTTTSSVAAAAVVTGTTTATFPSDAVLAWSAASSLTGDAIFGRTVVATLSADAVINVSQQTISGSVSADALLSATRSGSLVADAIRKTTRGGSLYSNANSSGNIYIGQVTTETAIPGCAAYFGSTGGSPVTVTWDFWFSHNQNGTFKHEVIHLRRDGPTGTILATSDPQGGGGDNGDTTSGHQFHSVGSFVDSSPTTGVYVLSIVSVAGQAGIYSDTRAFSASYGSASNLTFAASATAKVTQYSASSAASIIRSTRNGSLTSDAIRLRTMVFTGEIASPGIFDPGIFDPGIFDVGSRGSFDPEAFDPAAFDHGGIGTADGPGISLDAFIASSETTRSGSFAASAIVSMAVTSSLSGDAVVRREIASGRTVDAIIRRTSQPSLTTDAIVRRSQTGSSLTANAYVSLRQTGSFTASADIRAVRTPTFTASAFLLAPNFGALIASAVVRGSRTGSVAADAIIRKAVAGTFSANATVASLTTQAGSLIGSAVLRGAMSGTFTASSLLRVARSGSLAAAAAIRTSPISALPASAVIKRSASGSTPASAVVKAVTAGSMSASSVVRRVGASSLASSAVVRRSATGSLTADAMFLRQSSGQVAANATVLATRADGIVASALVVVPRFATLTADAVLQRRQAGAIGADALIAKTVIAATTADAAVRATRTDGFSGAAVLRSLRQASFAAESLLLITVPGAFASDARIIRVTTASFTSDAALLIRQAGSIAAGAVLDIVRTAPLTAEPTAEHLWAEPAAAHLLAEPSTEHLWAASGWSQSRDRFTGDAVIV
jgi:hypothetical protein